jgi:hypothetical protein
MVKKRIPSSHVYPLFGAPFMPFWNSLSCNCELRDIIDEGLVALKEDRCAGIPIKKDKIPDDYQRFGISNLYKMNLRKNYRLTYTLITLDEGICPHIIEVMTHPEYLRRFGYTR